MCWKLVTKQPCVENSGYNVRLQLIVKERKQNGKIRFNIANGAVFRPPLGIPAVGVFISQRSMHVCF